MELFRQYLLEREGAHLIEKKWGFATYSFEQDCVYLQDIYVIPSERDSKKGIKLMNEVVSEAKKAKLNYLLGSVDDKGAASEKMHKIMDKLGFKKLRKSDSVTYYVKEI